MSVPGSKLVSMCPYQVLKWPWIALQDRNRCACSSWFGLCVSWVASCDGFWSTPWFLGGPRTRPVGTFVVWLANRYWSNPHRGRFCALEDRFRAFSMSSSIHVKSDLPHNTVSSEHMHRILQRITPPQPVGAGARQPACKAISLHGINIGPLTLHD